MSVARFIARRAGRYLVALWVAGTLDFFLTQLTPSTRIIALNGVMRSEPCDPACLRALQMRLGEVNQGNVLVQYIQFWGSLLHGNLGVSYFESGQPVSNLITDYLPRTIALLAVATAIILVLGASTGLLLGWRSGSRLDRAVPRAPVFPALPYVFLALIILLAMAAVELLTATVDRPSSLYDFPILPAPGWGPGYLWNLLANAILPAGTMVLASVAGLIVGVRNRVLTAMGEDHVLAARAQGLSGRRVRWSVLRSAILPGACGVPLAIGLVVTIQLLVEVVFSYPGIGYLLFRAVINHDYPLLRGVIVVIVVVALAANLLADVMGAFIDPRSRQEAWPEVRAPGRATRPHPA